MDEKIKTTEGIEGKILTSVEQTRIRINYRVSAKGDFQPDITSEAETVETAMANFRKADLELNKFAIEMGYIKKEGI